MNGVSGATDPIGLASPRPVYSESWLVGANGPSEKAVIGAGGESWKTAGAPVSEKAGDDMSENVAAGWSENAAFGPSENAAFGESEKPARLSRSAVNWRSSVALNASRTFGAVASTFVCSVGTTTPYSGPAGRRHPSPSQI